MIYTLLTLTAFGLYYYNLNEAKNKVKSLEPNTEPSIKLKNPYHPTELGINNWLKRRWPQFYKRAAIVGDVSPKNPLPFRANVQERRDLYDGQWGHAKVNAELQFNQIRDKLVFDETHPRLLNTYKLPEGKQRWRKDASNYSVFTV